MSFEGDTKSCRSLLSGVTGVLCIDADNDWVSFSGEEKDPTGGGGVNEACLMCT